MVTLRTDPTFQPGSFVFGYSLPGSSYFGRHRSYNQFAVFGIRTFGTQIPGKTTEDDMFAFVYGAQLPAYPRRRPVTPAMCIRLRGPWARRVIYYLWRGQQRVRRYSPNDSAAKECLVPSMLKLMESSFLWSILTDENKARLAADAKRTRQATQGHNYFTKLYIRDDPRWMNYV